MPSSVAHLTANAIWSIVHVLWKCLLELVPVTECCCVVQLVKAWYRKLQHRKKLTMKKMRFLKSRGRAVQKGAFCRHEKFAHRWVNLLTTVVNSPNELGILIIIGIPSFTHSFTLGLNPFLQILPTTAFPFSPSGFTIWLSQTVYC